MNLWCLLNVEQREYSITEKCVRTCTGFFSFVHGGSRKQGHPKSSEHTCSPDTGF